MNYIFLSIVNGVESENKEFLKIAQNYELAKTSIKQKSPQGDVHG